MTSTAFALLSGGLDSTTALYIARSEFKVVRAVGIDYGQRHKKELEFAKRTCAKLGIRHDILPIKDIVPKTMLTDGDSLIPNISYDEIKGVSPTYVPFRNGLMLAALASFAQGSIASDDTQEHALYFGAHAEDAKNWAYPDCTPEWIGATAASIYIGTYGKIRLHAPLMWMTKAEIVSRGNVLGVHWEDTWSCYAGGDVHCGVCPTCRARKQAFNDAGVNDPTAYAV
jgi:7-cyano-7-deazaguanine synthase